MKFIFDNFIHGFCGLVIIILVITIIMGELLKSYWLMSKETVSFSTSSKRKLLLLKHYHIQWINLSGSPSLAFFSINSFVELKTTFILWSPISIPFESINLKPFLLSETNSSNSWVIGFPSPVLAPWFSSKSNIPFIKVLFPTPVFPSNKTLKWLELL